MIGNGPYRITLSRLCWEARTRDYLARRITNPPRSHPLPQAIHHPRDLPDPHTTTYLNRRPQRLGTRRGVSALTACL